MKIPEHLLHSPEWTLVGPMGPDLPLFLTRHSILGVDGGSRFAPKLDLWVGDSDSGMPTNQCPVSYRFPAEKAESDLALALSLLAPIPRLKIHLWGFHGGRMDHELINFGECLRFLEKRTDCEILVYSTSGSIIQRIFGPGHWSFTHQGIFSVVCLTPTTLTLKGACQYQVLSPLEFLPFSSRGLSNVGQGEMYLINQAAVMLMFPEQT